MERRDGARLCGATRQLSARAKISRRISHSRGSAWILRQRLELPLESAGMGRHGLCSSHGGFPRLEWLWRTFRKIYYRTLGRSAPYGPAERLELRLGPLQLLGWRSGLRSRWIVRRLHGCMDCRELDPALEVLGQPRRRIRRPPDVLLHRYSGISAIAGRRAHMGETRDSR